MSDHDQRDYIDEALRPLAARLRMRYPGVRIVTATLRPCREGDPSSLQQTVRYQAPLALLRHVGLVTDAMMAQVFPCDARRREVFTLLGDHFFLSESLDQASRPGCHDLNICTGITPRERDRFSVKEAERLLRRIARSARGRKGAA